MLRYSSPVVNFRRTVMEDTEIRGQPVRAGDKVVVFYGSGNRDEDVFADPDRFDVGRDPNPHIAFGAGGPHLCLGMHVARIESKVMLRELLTRLPNLAPAGTSERLASNFIAGVAHHARQVGPGGLASVEARSGPCSLIVVRRRSRGCRRSSNPPARCSMQRLSQITRSPSRHTWL